MKKNTILMALALSIAFNSAAQIAQPPALSKSVNSTIIYQVLNDFDRTIPIALFVPGFFFIGNIQISNNPFFNESDFYEEIDMPNSSNFYQQIVSDAASASFLPYIPKDSVMKVRIMDEKKLIFEMVFKNEQDTIVFNLTNGKQNKNKSIGYFNDKVITTSYNDERKMVRYSSRLYGDTLRRSELRNIDRRSFTNINYTNGLPTMVSYFIIDENTKKERLKDSEHFLYNENNQPTLKQYLNGKGKITKTINYHYKGDTLTQYTVNEGSAVVFTVTNDYFEKENSLVRSYYARDLSYTKVTYLKEVDQMNLEIAKSVNTIKRLYMLRSDINHRLSELEYMMVKSGPESKESNKRWVFNYNTKGNLSAIKVINKKGKIVKTIILEYSFMNL